MKFNFIATTYRYKESEAMKEIKMLMNDDINIITDIKISEISGIILGNININPIDIVRKFKNIVTEEPWQFRYILRMIPIEITIKTDLLDITNNAVKKALEKIQDNESYKITVEKRHTNLKSNEIITNIASEINRKVLLDEPDWIILIEVIGRDTGISVIRKEDIFNSVIEKRNI
ncbi:MAG: THUMP domain-containing protein [Nitrososphaeraceae archaeon]